jgi:hypothetical protein
MNCLKVAKWFPPCIVTGARGIFDHFTPWENVVFLTVQTWDEWDETLPRSGIGSPRDHDLFRDHWENFRCISGVSEIFLVKSLLWLSKLLRLFDVFNWPTFSKPWLMSHQKAGFYRLVATETGLSSVASEARWHCTSWGCAKLHGFLAVFRGNPPAHAIFCQINEQIAKFRRPR